MHRTWLCDGDTDCPDGSDESEDQCGVTQSPGGGGVKRFCRTDQFTCDDGTCIPGHLQCSGQPECPDESDEKMCSKYLHYFYSHEKLFCSSSATFIGNTRFARIIHEENM